MQLGKEIKKRKPFECREEEAFLNIVRAADVLSADFAELFKQQRISSTQYNVLRILRGEASNSGEGLSCGEIAERMITRDPDITRLLDRLEKSGLVSRCREEKDRRVVRVRITPAGEKLLAELDPLIRDAHRKQLGHLGEEKLKQLIALLEEARHSTTSRNPS